MKSACENVSEEVSEGSQEAISEAEDENDDNPFLKKQLITLVVDHVRITCNRQQLCKYSYYFQGMFRSGMQECDMDTICMGSPSPEILKILVDFTYDESLAVTEENLSDILHAANMYQFPAIEEQCEEFLRKNLDSSNSFQIMLLADTYALYSLYNYARSWTLWHFSAVTQSESFLQATTQHVAELFTEDMLNVASEVEVFMAAMTWSMCGAQSSCEMALYSVLEHVRFGSLTEVECGEVLKHPTVAGSPGLSNYIEGRMRNCKHKPRRVPLVVHVLGSHCSLPSLAEAQPGDPGPALPMELLRVNERCSDFQLVSCSKLTRPLPQGCSATVVGCCVYICGGEQQLGRNAWVMDIWEYHSLKQKWAIVGTLTHPRRHHTAVAWGEKLVLIGGCGRYRVILDSVDTYDMVKGTHGKLPSLRDPTYMAAATVCGDRLYVIKNHIEYLSKDSAQWTRLEADLPYHRGIRHCLPLEKNLCLSMQGQILVFNPDTLEVISTHKFEEDVCLLITTTGGDIYALSYGNSYEHSSPSSYMVLTLRCLKETAANWETLISRPKPDLKISSIFNIPTYPTFKEFPRDKLRYEPKTRHPDLPISV